MVYDKEDGQIILSMNIMYNSLNINYKENFVFLFDFFAKTESMKKKLSKDGRYLKKNKIF